MTKLYTLQSLDELGRLASLRLKNTVVICLGLRAVLCGGTPWSDA